MTKKMLWIINAKAGKAEISQYVLSCIDIFIKAGYQVDVHTTQARGDAQVVTAQRAAEYDRIVCSGGDGTLSEVVSGLQNAGVQIPLGFIPSGTTNDFATSIGIPRGPLVAAQTVVFGKEFPLDIGQFQERYFIYVAAFGLFTDVSYTTPQNAKNIFGRSAYIMEGLKDLTQIKKHQIAIESDEVNLEGEFVFGMVSNSTSVGGFKGIARSREIEMDDGLFEVLLVRQPENILQLQDAMTELLQDEQTASNIFVHFKTKHLIVRSNHAIAWTLDGEFGGKTKCAEISNLHRAVRMIADK